MKKAVKYILIILAGLFLLYFSFDIENLQEYQARTEKKTFSVQEYATAFWNNDLPIVIEAAPGITQLLKGLQENPDQAFLDYGHKLGISSTYYFFVRGQGEIVQVEDESVIVKTTDGTIVKLATAYIYGNAVRDGSGRVDINKFENMTTFNATSVEINKIIKQEIVPTLLSTARQGRKIAFAGALEMKESQLAFDSLRIIPVYISLLNDE